MIGCKDHLTANLLKCINRELFALWHRTTEVLLIPLRGIVIQFTEAIVPFCHNVLRCIFNGIKDMLGVVLKTTGHCAVDAGDDEHLGVLKKGGVAGSIFLITRVESATHTERVSVFCTGIAARVLFVPVDDGALLAANPMVGAVLLFLL